MSNLAGVVEVSIPDSVLEKYRKVQAIMNAVYKHEDALFDSQVELSPDQAITYGASLVLLRETIYSIIN